MLISLLIFLFGFILLIQGADKFIEGSASLAHRFKIPPLVIGLTIVSFGTSAPETLISATASFNNHTAMALGNVFGSIITNTLLGLGLASVIAPLTVQNSTVWKEIPLLLLSMMVVCVMALDTWIDGQSLNVISRSEGLVLFGFFAVFLAYTVALSKNKSNNSFIDTIKEVSLMKSGVYFILGLVGLIWGSRLSVQSAVDIASHYGVSESLIGLTVIAIGTSLPEITTATMASYKGQSDMAVGNVVGANLFNALWILGLSATIRPLEILPIALKTALFAGFTTILLLVFLWSRKQRILSRLEGSVFLALYLAYTVYLIFNPE